MPSDDISTFTKTVDSLIIGAPSVPEMYRRLNVLNRNGRGGWQLLCDPMWVRGVLIAVLLRPDLDDVQDNSESVSTTMHP